MENSRGNFKKTLTNYFKAGIKGVYIYTEEKESAKRIIKEEVLKETGADFVFFEYSLDNGLVAEDYKPLKNLRKSFEGNMESIKDISFVLNYIIKQIDDGYIEGKFTVIIFDDICKTLDNDILFASTFYNKINELISRDVYFYIVSTQSIVPRIIEKKVFYVELPIMSKDEIRDLLTKKIEEEKIRVHGELTKERVVNALYGLTEEEINNVVKLSIADGDLDDEDVRNINLLKRQIIKKSGLLEFVITDEKMENIGGFKRLKEWIGRKKEIVDRMEEAKRFGVDMPKGIMLFGMPGCGKSLSAKAIANIFGIPLLRLDMGLILGPYVGMSEENMRKAIIQAESISPCVLWIDEIEKALAGVGGSGGSAEVTTRIFGSLLTWMQEKKNMVFVIATSNNISNMPPEFLRKGRFDEIFFVDFPDKESRREIIKIHLIKRKKGDWINKINIDEIVNRTEEFAGSDLEALVAEIVEDAFINKRNEPDLDFVRKRLENYVPLSKSIKNEIEDMRKRCQQYKFINVN